MTDEKDDTTERVAQLERELAELKSTLPKPPTPFTPEPYQQYDPTANMSMSRSAMEEMARVVPTGMIRDIVHDNRAPTGRPGMIPSQPSDVRPPANVPGSGTGWQTPRELRPPPGVEQADRLMDEQDRRDRAELAQRLGALGKR